MFNKYIHVQFEFQWRKKIMRRPNVSWNFSCPLERPERPTSGGRPFFFWPTHTQLALICVGVPCRIGSEVSCACQLILTYQFVFIWLFLTTYWLRKGITGQSMVRSRTTQWPYYIIIMIMLILLQLIPTPLYVARAESLFSAFSSSYLLAFYLLWLRFVSVVAIVVLLLTVLKIICKRI